MTKSEFITAVAEKTAITKKDAEDIVNSMFDIITDTLSKDERVQIIGFGTFEPRERKARKCINPHTKEKMMTKAKRVPVFKAGKALKNKVAETKPKKTKTKKAK